MSERLANLVAALTEHVAHTDHQFATLGRPVGHPIPFFGDLPSATVVTIGLNPVCD